MACATEAHMLGSSIGPEKVHREYKEFSSGITSASITASEISGIVNGDISHDVDELFLRTLRYNYINKFLPRYVSSMGNTMLDRSHGEFYVGVNDSGIITGIPTINKDFVSIVIGFVRDCLKSLIRIQVNGETQETPLELYGVCVDGLDVCEELILDDADEIINDYETQLKLAQQEELKMMDERRIYIDIISKYVVSIVSLSNTMWYRHEVAEWISNDTYLEHILDLETKDKIDDCTLDGNRPRKLSDDEKRVLIDFFQGDGFVDGDADGGIIRRKCFPLDPLCWTTHYRDYIIWKLRKSAPERRRIIYPRDVYSLLAHTLTPLASKFIQTGIKYYLLKVLIPSKEKLMEHFSCDEDSVTVEYLENDAWCGLIRYHVEPQGPSNLPI